MNDFVIKNGILKEYTGPGGDVVIPEGVTEIGDYAFGQRSTLHHVVIPEGVTKIGRSAFSTCTCLQQLELPSSVTEIGDWAFYSCFSLCSVILPNGITKIGKRSFDYCVKIQSLVIPETVTFIGSEAFSFCRGLQDVVIHSATVRIGSEAFYACSSLKNIEFPRYAGALSKDMLSYCSDLEFMIAPFLRWESIRESKLQFVAAMGYLRYPEKFADSPHLEEYIKYIAQQRKRILSAVFQEDDIQPLEIYAAAGKITAKNFNTHYLEPAQRANATGCIAWLLNWKNEHFAPGGSGKWHL